MRIKECLSLLILLSFSSAASIAVEAEDMDGRIESARRIIRDITAYESEAHSLIAQMQATTQEAKSLSGQAHKYQSTIAPKMKPLTGARLAAAKKMYQSDLDAFADHAKAYRAHTENVHSQFGQCEASKRAYEKTKNAYALHMKQFHMEDIPPPHMCIDLGAMVNDANITQGNVKGTVKRMLDAQRDLMKAEIALRVAQRNSPMIDAQARKQNELNLQEQSLASEFAQLEEEYRQLQVEHNVLNPGKAHTGVSTVHGRVRNSQSH